MSADTDDLVERARVLLSPLDAALLYAAGGWAVLAVAAPGPGGCRCGRACDSPGKHPLTRRGVHDATRHPGRIRSWWRRWPQGNVGIATGAASALGVVDVDLDRGGEASLDALRHAGRVLPPTTMVTTGGGGLHLFYRQPPGAKVPNTVGRLPGVQVPLSGIDLRGDGGYVVAPPSVHRSGRRYHWARHQPSAMAPLPPWLAFPPPPPPPARPASAGAPPGPGADAYGRAALAREVDAVRALVAGQRNDGLNRSAFCLGRLVGAGALCADVVREELEAAAAAVGLPATEAERTVRSGLRAGARVPCPWSGGRP